MEYRKIGSVDDPYFAKMHRLMGEAFPPEEVLAFDLWKEPLLDLTIQVYVAVLDGEVVGATEYRYRPEFAVAMTDFTIVGRPGLGIGRFLLVQREAHLRQLEAESGTASLGMFAEIYDPSLAEPETGVAAGRVSPMHPAVRREVLSHLGFKKLDLDYVHPSWDHEGKAVKGLDFCFRPADETRDALPASLPVGFLRWYYAALPNKPQEWHEMMARLEARESVRLLPI
ncbi:GNAT family N-acetyltransferase [Cohnella nanjingensis]|uniref:GNAT family N-acetyltransferase n=1 Tax=Cohnella nanjingensis TaxID=1387779 RepID=A0A7X0RN82_9BACL|nr:GNAT family N-acetyltransferase [Cohnella nanjingensis]MBB6669184.1 GNAT family N-acetyltransferase [Cohnella nanjingensis]